MRQPMILAALGAVAAVLFKREAEAGALTSAALWAIVGAAIGYGIAWLVRSR